MKLEELLDKTEACCLDAVEHVGAANYADREAWALRRVKEAFSKLRFALVNHLLQDTSE